ncbi:hypothetical protein B0H10DRAFT_1964888 [Mycena sp. CBHHK59/15]|nr:hypothetical protein B0H10DRAFT_1964888 [Mycena sp. CBHHK59/15]
MSGAKTFFPLSSVSPLLLSLLSLCLHSSMPEIFEAGYFFPCYIWFFIVLITIVHGQNGLRIIGLWCDLSAGECKASKTRETALLVYARALDKQALARGHLSQWANDLQDFADAIPDTHGLMIYKVWQGLHPPIRRQISPNHASWDSFCDALRNLVHGVETVPTACELLKITAILIIDPAIESTHTLAPSPTRVSHPLSSR